MRHPKLDIGLLAAGWDQLSLLICVWLWVRPGRCRIDTLGLMSLNQMVIRKGAESIRASW